MAVAATVAAGLVLNAGQGAYAGTITYGPRFGSSDEQRGCLAYGQDGTQPTGLEQYNTPLCGTDASAAADTGAATVAARTSPSWYAYARAGFIDGRYSVAPDSSQSSVVVTATFHIDHAEVQANPDDRFRGWATDIQVCLYVIDTAYGNLACSPVVTSTTPTLDDADVTVTVPLLADPGASLPEGTVWVSASLEARAGAPPLGDYYHTSGFFPHARAQGSLTQIAFSD